MKTALLLVVALILAANTAYSARISDGCLKLVVPNDNGYTDTNGYWVGSSNPDSVMIDTCPGSSSYHRLFAKKWYSIQFPKNFYPFDNVLDSGEVKSVHDMSASYLDMKNSFLELQNTIGSVYFRGLDHFSSDSIFLLNPILQVSFGQYQDIDFILQYVPSTIDSIRSVRYVNRAGTPIGVKEESEQYNFSIYPNPVRDYLTINHISGSIKDKIEIISIAGKKLFESDYKDRIDVSLLHSGSYFLRINNQTIKFIKE